MKDCIFCKIVAGEIPAKVVHETEHSLAFHDVNPALPIHILIIPKIHISTVNDVKPEHAAYLADMYQVARDIARKLEIDEKGYRLVTNINSDGGQTVFHIHTHLLAGRKMDWPPF